VEKPLVTEMIIIQSGYSVTRKQPTLAYGIYLSAWLRNAVYSSDRYSITFHTALKFANRNQPFNNAYNVD
jgi:hypothetical protein